MRRIRLSSWLERYFPKPGSNRGYQLAEVVKVWMLHGGRYLEDVRHLYEDKAIGLAACAECGHAGGLAAALGQR